MKKGDVVTITDDSYSKVVTDHGLEDGYAGFPIRDEQGVIIEVDCNFPDRHKYQVKNHTGNDTVVRTNSGKIVFIEERFLRPVPPKHLVWIDVVQENHKMSGRLVEISDKLYKEIKRDS